MSVFEFGLVDGRVRKTYKAADTDGDVATFTLSGGGQGSFWANQIGLLNTTARSVLTISVKKGKNGDGLFQIGDIVSDGLLKSINGKGISLSGQVLLNTLDKPAINKSALSMTLAQMNGAEILPQNLPLSSITVSGDVSDSRILTSGSLTKFTASSLLDSQILLGVSCDFDRLCASSTTDFTHPSAKLGTLSISGKKVAQGQPAPAYVVNSHISAPNLGTVTLINVALHSGPILHILNDTGTLKVTTTKLATEPVLAPGTWKLMGVRPAIWEVL